MIEDGLFTSVLGGSADITLWGFFACVFTALALGAILTNVMMYRSNCSKSFAITVALLPLIISTIVLLVSDNFGAGLAIAGAFSLIRFRSAFGSAKEIMSLFIAVAVGIACGVGYIGIAAFFTAAVLVVYVIYSNVKIWDNHKDDSRYRLTLNYALEPTKEDIVPVLDELLASCTTVCEKVSVSAKLKKKMSKTVIVYDLELSEPQETLVQILKKSGLKMEFTLEKTKKATVKRL